MMDTIIFGYGCGLAEMNGRGLIDRWEFEITPVFFDPDHLCEHIE
jgi:hypothetical protein